MIKTLGGAFALALAGLAATGSVQAGTTMKFHHWLPPQAMVAKDVITPWAGMVEQASKGAIEIKIYPTMQLGGTPQQIVDQVKNGVVELALGLPGYNPGSFPRLEVFELPSVYNGDPMSTSLAIADLTDGVLAKDYSGIVPVLQAVHAGNVIHCRDKAIRSVADFKGLKIRSPSRTGQFMLEALGATPVGMPVTSVPEALSKGVIDCAALPWEIAGSFKVEELAKYHTILPGDRRFGTAVIFIIMNKAAYEALPEAERAAVDANAGPASARFAAEQWIKGENPGRQAAINRGNEIIELPATEAEIFAEAMKSVETRWIALVGESGVDGAAIVAAAKEAIARHSAGN